nr:MAG: ORF1 [Torque teno midi virus]
MPFYYWRRRNRWWRPRYSWRRRRKRYPRRRKRRRIYRRQRPYRTSRRRHKRRRKVRRKLPFLPVRQWQPDSIRKCKIKGVDALIIGAEGKQLTCYTDVSTDNVAPKAPMGGGFAVEVFTLYSLYTDNRFHKNIWTASNIGMDLCRYLRCKLTFYRHQHTDFIVAYKRQPPFNFTKWTYPSAHPYFLMQEKHKKFVMSKNTKPNGPLKTKMIIKPPKQMLTKWFFSKEFCTAQLFQLLATAANLNFSYLACCNTSNQVSLFYINQKFYQNANWGAQSTTAYKPYNGVPSGELSFKYLSNNQTLNGTFTVPTTYNNSVSWDKGWFTSKVLRITEWTKPSVMATTPLNVARYNPSRDDGVGNIVYLTSVHNTKYDPPISDKTIVLRDLPIWVSLWGFLEYVIKIKNDKQFLASHCVVIVSQYIYPLPQIGANTYYIPVSQNFVNGNAPYNEYLTSTMKANWFPTVQHQIEILNAIVECGPYVPKYSQDRESNWELKFEYNFLFKWGGPHGPEKDIADPKTLQKYPVPDTMQGRLQIQNPLKQETDSFLHSWDFRRGIVTDKAFKRMCQNLEPDTDFQSDQEEALPKKKARLGRAMQATQEEVQEMQTCLQELCEENIYQETQDQENLQQFIQFQQQQQLQLKRNILKLLMDLKEKQTALQLQTGMFN